MRNAVLVVLLLAATALAPLGAHGAAVPAPSVENTLRDLRVGNGVAGGEILSYVGRSLVHAPPGIDRAVRALVGPSAVADLDGVPGLDPDVPFTPKLQATVLAGGPVYQTTVGARHSVGNALAYNGVVAAGSHVHEGEQVESFVSAAAAPPLIPPRAVVPGGVLAWDTVSALSERIVTLDWDANASDFVRAERAVLIAAAHLRVDGGGLVATQDVPAPTLLVPLPGFRSGIVIASRQTSLPDVAFSYAQAIAEDEAGGLALRVTAAVKAGSAWPQSGDEDARGTWKMRIDVTAVDLSGFDDAADGMVAVELGPQAPGTETVLLLNGAEPRTLPPNLGASFVLHPGPRLEDVQVRPWPAVEAPQGAFAPPATDHGGVAYASTGVGPYQAPGALSFTLDHGLAEDVLMNGRSVGAFGLPWVEVHGRAFAPVLYGAAPHVREHAYWVSPTNYGAQFWISYQGHAGGLEFDAVMLVTLNPSTASLLPLILSWQSPQPVAARFVWLVDPDAGAGEQFLAFGAAPVAVETALASDGLTGLFALQPPHVLAAEGGTLHHTLTMWSLGEVLVHAAEGLPRPPLPFPPPPEATVTPPQPLVGEDVALLVTTTLVGDHSGSYYNRSPLMASALAQLSTEAQQPLESAGGLGILALGQTGLTWYLTITGV